MERRSILAMVQIRMGPLHLLSTVGSGVLSPPSPHHVAGRRGFLTVGGGIPPPPSLRPVTEGGGGAVR